MKKMRFSAFILILIFFLSCEKERKKDDKEKKTPVTSFSIRNANYYLLSPVACINDSCIVIEPLEAFETSEIIYVKDTVIRIQYQILDKHVIMDNPYVIPSLKHTVITITDDYDPYPGTIQ